ncbi:hypothetical protein NCS56_01217900 [Fusarium sp. Ph1]|nr:hypothetical protein NCS56_01217900 [Fusarium sp. Ph1]
MHRVPFLLESPDTTLHPSIIIMAELRLAIASVSLGRSAAGHGLIHKIQQAALHSFQGVEIFYECLEHLACSLPGGLSEKNLLAAAEKTRAACDSHGITVVCLQPFGSAEGLLDAEAREDMFQRLRLWIKISHALGCDLIQVPTNFLPGKCTTGDFETICADLREISQIGMEASPRVRLAYEAVSWGTHIDIWEGAWEVVKAVNMPNLGLCLDTFHITGRVWGDPTSKSGKNVEADRALDVSLSRMVNELHADKIFYIQSGDAQKLEPPLSEQHPWHDPGQRPRMTWSRNGRLFAYEEDEGAYLPVESVLDAIINGLGYRGWVSLEAFSRELACEDSAIPALYAQRGLRSWQRMRESLGIADSAATGLSRAHL